MASGVIMNLCVSPSMSEETRLQEPVCNLTAFIEGELRCVFDRRAVLFDFEFELFEFIFEFIFARRGACVASISRVCVCGASCCGARWWCGGGGVCVRARARGRVCVCARDFARALVYASPPACQPAHLYASRPYDEHE